jgi:hypothetical protein
METKIRLAESVRDNCSGHFHWLFTSHENPGRVQGGEGLRELDRVGPVNYKGLLTAWGEPTDAFYMFRANYAPKEKEPMVYIVSHTWPDRWIVPGKKDSIVVYSNCDEVELFNDINKSSLGRKKNQGVGTHFQWDGVDIKYNVLYAVGYVNGKEVARDQVVLHHLPDAPGLSEVAKEENKVTSPQPGLNYLYRVNCGGPDYVDVHGNKWNADVHKTSDQTWGSTSWTDDFPGYPSFYASQRKTHDPITGTSDDPLFQTFRYGRDKLQYHFPLPDGEYTVELYFTEPWYGTGGGMDCTGWRLFDVSVNDKTVLKDLDIWKESGHDVALKKVIKVDVANGQLNISFPRVASGQAVISAIAIAAKDRVAKPAPSSPSVISNLVTPDANAKWSVQSWMDTGDKQYEDDAATFSALPANLYGATWIRTTNSNQRSPAATFTITTAADVYIGMDANIADKPQWLSNYEDTKTFIESAHAGSHKFKVFRKRFEAGATVTLANNGTLTGKNALMYTVAAIPVSAMQPAIDLRPTVSYKIDKARLTGIGIKSDTVLDRACATFTKNTGSTIEWNITPGVAGLYAIRFRYYHTSDKLRTAILKIIAADGTLMHEELLEFIPVNEKKWKIATASTGTMINAGNYKVVLTAADGEGLSVRDLEMQ